MERIEKVFGEELINALFVAALNKGNVYAPAVAKDICLASRLAVIEQLKVWLEAVAAWRDSYGKRVGKGAGKIVYPSHKLALHGSPFIAVVRTSLRQSIRRVNK